jgi:hypothetical protein
VTIRKITLYNHTKWINTDQVAYVADLSDSTMEGPEPTQLCEIVFTGGESLKASISHEEMAKLLWPHIHQPEPEVDGTHRRLMTEDLERLAESWAPTMDLLEGE